MALSRQRVALWIKRMLDEWKRKSMSTNDDCYLGRLIAVFSFLEGVVSGLELGVGCLQFLSSLIGILLSLLGHLLCLFSQLGHRIRHGHLLLVGLHWYTRRV